MKQRDFGHSPQGGLLPPSPSPTARGLDPPVRLAASPQAAPLRWLARGWLFASAALPSE
jgi:hypothetical protein